MCICLTASCQTFFLLSILFAEGRTHAANQLPEGHAMCGAEDEEGEEVRTQTQAEGQLPHVVDEQVGVAQSWQAVISRNQRIGNGVGNLKEIKE